MTSTWVTGILCISLSIAITILVCVPVTEGAINRVSADIGQNVLLKCDFQFPDGTDVPYVVQWQKQDSKIPVYIWYDGYPPHTAEEYEGRASLSGRSNLNLTNVRDSDHGWYECKIFFLNRPPETPENGTWILLDVQTPPEFNVKPPDVVYVKVGESLSLPCEANGTPSPAIQWFKEKIPLEAAGNVNILKHELRIANLRQVDTGDYICTAKNREGTITATTRVIVAGPAVITGPPRNVTKNEGDKTELVCLTKALPSNVTHRWSYNSEDVNQVSSLSNRISIKRDGTLVISPTNSEDTGRFTCEVSNGIGLPDSASAFLSVEYPARVTYSPTIQFLPLGLSGIVRCYVQANPAFQFITWTKDRRPFEPNNFPGVMMLKNGSLLFQKVSNEHQGAYRCTPYNIYGTQGPSNTMEILVREVSLLSTAKPTGGGFPVSVNGHHELRTTPTPSVVYYTTEGSASTDPPKPGPPRNVSVQRVAQGFAISWLPPADPSPPPAYYYVDYKENMMDPWKHWGPVQKETSYLAKNLTSDQTYIIRVAAYSVQGHGQATLPYEFHIPGSSPKHNKDKAMAAGVVGGILFFIAAIVLSVCAVKICNKRKRRKAEKAFMMVTCPIMDARSVIGHSHGGSPVSLQQHSKSRVSSIIRWVNRHIVDPVADMLRVTPSMDPLNTTHSSSHSMPPPPSHHPSPNHHHLYRPSRATQESEVDRRSQREESHQHRRRESMFAHLMQGEHPVPFALRGDGAILKTTNISSAPHSQYPVPPPTYYRPPPPPPSTHHQHHPSMMPPSYNNHPQHHLHHQVTLKVPWTSPSPSQEGRNTWRVHPSNPNPFDGMSRSLPPKSPSMGHHHLQTQAHHPFHHQNQSLPSGHSTISSMPPTNPFSSSPRTPQGEPFSTIFTSGSGSRSRFSPIEHVRSMSSGPFLPTFATSPTPSSVMMDMSFPHRPISAFDESPSSYFPVKSQDPNQTHIYVNQQSIQQHQNTMMMADQSWKPPHPHKNMDHPMFMTPSSLLFRGEDHRHAIDPRMAQYSNHRMGHRVPHLSLRESQKRRFDERILQIRREKFVQDSARIRRDGQEKGGDTGGGGGGNVLEHHNLFPLPPSVIQIKPRLREPEPESGAGRRLHHELTEEDERVILAPDEMDTSDSDLDETRLSAEEGDEPELRGGGRGIEPDEEGDEDPHLCQV